MASKTGMGPFAFLPPVHTHLVGQPVGHSLEHGSHCYAGCGGGGGKWARAWQRKRACARRPLGRPALLAQLDERTAERARRRRMAAAPTKIADPEGLRSARPRTARQPASHTLDVAQIRQMHSAQQPAAVCHPQQPGRPLRWRASRVCPSARCLSVCLSVSTVTAGPSRQGLCSARFSPARTLMPGWRWSWAAMVCCCGHLLAASAAASFPPQPPPNETRGMSRHRVLDSQAVCNDGSPAYFYWRNCTANSDWAPGDKQDYCAKGGKEGVDQVVWMLVFESAGFCYDARSCAARESHRTSSSWLPPTIFPSGGLSCFPEENPNFYKATTVFVPSCSSDLWLGDAAHSLGGSGGGGRTFFRGRRILSAVLRQLARPLAGADVLVIAGSAGVMAALHSPTVTALLPARLQVRLVCDGCLLSAAPPLRSVAQQPCTTDTDCPPKEALVSPSPRSTDMSAPHPADKSISPRTDRCVPPSPLLSFTKYRLRYIIITISTLRRHAPTAVPEALLYCIGARCTDVEFECPARAGLPRRALPAGRGDAPNYGEAVASSGVSGPPGGVSAAGSAGVARAPRQRGARLRAGSGRARPAC
eukprot:COSAG01_NODE_493_length_16327_cov_5.632879_17_plen_588_part_01